MSTKNTVEDYLKIPKQYNFNNALYNAVDTFLENNGFKRINGKEASGSFNKIFFIEKEGKKYVLRVSKIYLSKINKKGEEFPNQQLINKLLPENERTGNSKEDIIILIKKIQDLSLLASAKEYSPKLYWLKPLDVYNDGHIEKYLSTIYEAYDSDLIEYYMKNKVRDTAKDNIIAKQIEHIITNMNKNGIVCFDINPRNIVIKETEEDGIDVKIIDWDLDYCKHIQVYKDLVRSQNIKAFNMVFIANHFVKYLDKNIFTEYFESEEFQNIKPNLQGEICSTIDTIYSRDMYLMMIKHYFNDLYNSVYSEVLSKNNITTIEEFCKILIERLINIATFRTSNVIDSNSASNSASNSYSKSASNSDSKSDSKSAKKPVYKSAKKPVYKSAKKPVYKSAKKLVKKLVRNGGKRKTNKIIKKGTKKKSKRNVKK